MRVGDQRRAQRPNRSVDDEGVDLGFKRRNGTRVLDVQVKARFSDKAGSKALFEDGRFSTDVRLETFRPRDDLYMPYLAINGPKAEIEWVWLGAFDGG